MVFNFTSEVLCNIRNNNKFIAEFMTNTRTVYRCNSMLDTCVLKRNKIGYGISYLYERDLDKHLEK